MRKKDYTGMVFGRLTAVKEAGMRKGYSLWHMRCACGNEVIAPVSYAVVGDKKSCGCLLKENNKRGISNLRHGDAKHGKRHRLYSIWAGMKNRCYSKSSQSYNHYGERNIAVCKTWRENYSAFKEWALKSGYLDSLTIERKDVNGDYEPGNCCFIPNNEQSLNKTDTVYVNFKGEKISLTSLAKLVGLPRDILYARLRAKWGVTRAASAPLIRKRTKNRLGKFEGVSDVNGNGAEKIS